MFFWYPCVRDCVSVMMLERSIWVQGIYPWKLHLDLCVNHGLINMAESYSLWFVAEIADTWYFGLMFKSFEFDASRAKQVLHVQYAKFSSWTENHFEAIFKPADTIDEIVWCRTTLNAPHGFF